MSLKAILWACDPIGSLLFILSATLMLLALDWAGGAYEWNDVQVAVPLSLGLALLVAFCIYGRCLSLVYPLHSYLAYTHLIEWKGRSDGLVAHVFFEGGPNFGLSVFAFAVEG